MEHIVDFFKPTPFLLLTFTSGRTVPNGPMPYSTVVRGPGLAAEQDTMTAEADT